MAEDPCSFINHRIWADISPSLGEENKDNDINNQET